MNYLHTRPTKIVLQFVNFRFILPKMAASLFSLSLIVVSFTVTISSLHSLKDSIWYSLQIGLVIKEFDFGTLTVASRTLSSFPLMSLIRYPFVGWFLFVDVILWFSCSILKYFLRHRSQKWFITLLTFLEWKFISCVMSIGYRSSK